TRCRATTTTPTPPSGPARVRPSASTTASSVSTGSDVTARTARAGAPVGDHRAPALAACRGHGRCGVSLGPGRWGVSTLWALFADESAHGPTPATFSPYRGS